jgi:hypothetical protein
VEKDRISKVSGIPSSQWYDMYLGLSTMVGKSRIATFKGIIDKSVEEIIGLEIKILVVGREGSLIKSIGTRKNVGGMGFKDFRNSIKHFWRNKVGSFGRHLTVFLPKLWKVNITREAIYSKLF